jgi:hypothetical protein
MGKAEVKAGIILNLRNKERSWKYPATWICLALNYILFVLYIPCIFLYI